MSEEREDSIIPLVGFFDNCGIINLMGFEVHEQSSLKATGLHIIEKDEAVKGETQLVG